jgi:hypothetical protein
MQIRALVNSYVSQKTTVDSSLLTEDDAYLSLMSSLIKSGATFNQTVNELTDWVNANY